MSDHTKTAVQPLVSVLIPAYNAESWIADTIKSALSQSWPRKEIIIVDDGSKDGTLSIAQRFVSKEVSVVSQPNAGGSAARNRAFALSHGDYIQWLDSDDLLAPDKIARQMEATGHGLSKRTVLSSPWGRFFYRRSKAKFSPTSLWSELSPVEWLLRKFEQGVYMPPASWLVSRELTEAAGPWDTRLSFDDDGEYFVRVIAGSDDVRFIPDARTYYRVSGSGSMSHIGGSNKKLESLFLSMQLHINHFRSLEDSDRVRAACLNYLRMWLIYFYPARLDIIERIQQLAAALGGQLARPGLRRKYAWIEQVFGWGTARRAEFLLPNLKAGLLRFWDKALFRLERGALKQPN